jgi:hypothetical protein
VTYTLIAGLIVVLALGVRDAVRRLDDVDRRRDQALESTFDVADATGSAAEAFRTFRSTLAVGDRFALVFASDVDRDRRGLYRLVSLSYLYPAIATSHPSGADAVMVFGPPSASVRRSFSEVAVVGDVWLGHRSS